MAGLTSIISRWFRRSPQAMLSEPHNPQGSSIFTYIGNNNSGIKVTPEVAFQVSTIWACIDVISSAIASSDWNIFERLEENDHDLLPNDPLRWLLNVRPNPEMTAKSFKQAMLIAATSWGNGYAEITRDGAGRVAGLWPIAPDRVDVLRNEGDLIYRVRNDSGTEVYIEPDNIFHIRGPGITGLLGDNVIAKSVRTVALTVAAERFGEAYFGNHTQLGVILEYPGEVSDTIYERLKKAWENRHQGPGKAFRVGVIEAGMKVHPMNVEADKAQLIEARKFQVEEVCRWFRVPPHKVAHLDRSTFNNIEHLGLEFTRDTLRPWAREIQEEAEEKLFSRRGRPRFMLIDLEWASRGDYKSRAEGHQIYRNMGVLSANDILKAEGRNTIGPDGDIRIVNGASTRLEDVGKNYAPLTSPTKPPSAPQESARSTFKAWLMTVFNRAERRLVNRLAEASRKEFGTTAIYTDHKSYIMNELDELRCAIILHYKEDPKLFFEHAARKVLDNEFSSDEASDFILNHLEHDNED